MSPKPLDLSGRKFGMLTAIRRLPERENGYCLWECACDCGGKAKVSTKKLLRGTVNNCGCIPKTTSRNGTIYEDITGRRFGLLTAISKEKSKGGKTHWLCACDCGGTRIVATSELKLGRVTHCGCEKRTNHTTFKNLQGQRFGRLTVIKPTEKRTLTGSVIWKCVCDCGNEVEVSSDSLKRGNTISCGCRKQEIKDTLHNELTFVDGTCIEWLSSRKNRCDNTSGFRGIYKVKNKWRVCIGFKGKRYYYGTYSTFEEAKAARLEIEKTLHDDFVRAWTKWNRRAIVDPDWASKNPLTFDVRKEGKKIYVYAPILNTSQDI